MKNSEKNKIKRELKGEPDVFVFIKSYYTEDDIEKDIPKILFVRGNDEEEAREHIDNNIWFNIRDYYSFGKLEDIRWSVVNGRDPIYIPEDEV